MANRRRTPRSILFLSLPAVLALLVTVPALAVPVYVDANGPGPGSGTAGDPYLTIQEGLNAAGNSDVIIVAPGTYNENLVLQGDRQLIGSGAGTTTIDGGAIDVVIRAESAGQVSGSRVQGFTLTNGSSGAGQQGAGVRVDGAILAIRDCVLSGNSAVQGGAVGLVSGATVSIQNTTISGNSATAEGGAIYSDGSFLDLKDVGLVDNDNGVTAPGRALYALGGTVDLTDCTVSASGIVAAGLPALYFGSSAVATMVNCTVSENTGGGVLVDDGADLGLTRCTIVDNQNCCNEAGITIKNGATADVTNCTIANNEATTLFGGMQVGGLNVGLNAVVTVTNSIVWGNLQDNVAVHPTGTLTVSYSDVEGSWPGTGNVDSDPLFTNAAAGDYTLQGGSPAIDMGDPASSFDDPDGSRSDMGSLTTSQVLVTFEVFDQFGASLVGSDFVLDPGTGSVLVANGGSLLMDRGTYSVSFRAGIAGVNDARAPSRTESFDITNSQDIRVLWETSETIVNVLDQFAAPIPASVTRLAGTGGLPSVAAGAPMTTPVTEHPAHTIGGNWGIGYLLQFSPGIAGLALSQAPTRTQDMEVPLGDQVLDITWEMASITIHVEDQFAATIPGSFWNMQGSGGLPGGATGTSVTLPITEDPQLPIGGSWGDGYIFTFQPGINGLTDSRAPTRTEILEVPTGGVVYTFEWKTASLTVNVTDEFGNTIPGSVWVISGSGGLGSGATGDSTVLPVTEDPPLVITGTWGTGYLVTSTPSVNGGSGANYFSRLYSNAEISPGANVLDIPWPVAVGTFHLVDAGENELPGSVVQIPGIGNYNTNTPLWLPVTEDTPADPNLGPINGPAGSGYNFWIRPSEPESFFFEGGNRLLPGKVFSPTFIDVGGTTVGLRWDVPSTCVPPAPVLTADDEPEDLGGAIRVDWSDYIPPPGTVRFEVIRSEVCADLSNPGLVALASVPFGSTDYLDSTAVDYVSYFYGVRVIADFGGETTAVLLIAAAASAKPNVVINEFCPIGEAPGFVEVVEVLFEGRTAVDLTGYRISNGPGPPLPDEEVLSGFTNAGGILVDTLTTISLPDEGGIIELYAPGAVVPVDQVLYGTSGGAPAPPEGLTAGRAPQSNSRAPASETFGLGEESFEQENFNIVEPDRESSLVFNEILHTQPPPVQYIELINPRPSTVALEKIAIFDGTNPPTIIDTTLVLRQGETFVLDGALLPDVQSQSLLLKKVLDDGFGGEIYQEVDRIGWVGGPDPGQLNAPDDALLRVGPVQYGGQDADPTWAGSGGGSVLFYGTRSKGTANASPLDTPVTNTAELNAALAAASPGDQIRLAAGTYSGPFNLVEGVTLRGAAAADVILTASGTAVIANGLSAGGLSSLTIQDSNRGLDILGSDITVEQVHFVDNLASGNGGGVLISGGAPQFKDCFFDGNTSNDDGGAVAVVSGTPEFERCVFVGNSVLGRGSAVYATGGITTLQQCVFDRNTGSVLHSNSGDIDASYSIVTSTLRGAPLRVEGGGQTGYIAFRCGALFDYNEWFEPVSGILDLMDTVLLDPEFCQPLALNYAYSSTSPVLSLDPGACPTAGITVGIVGPPCPGSPITTVDESNLPQRTRLYLPHPNPFNPATVLRFDLARSGSVNLEIYDLRGRRVSSPLESVPLAAGTHEVTWRGVDHRGRGVSSGVYFARLRIDGESVGETQRMLLLR